MRDKGPGEFERIRALADALPSATGVVLGPGDDAAVLRLSDGCDLVVTTDEFVEGRHVRFGLFDPEAIGRRLAIANLSDLAAMAARPRWATIAVAAPASADSGLLHAIELACARTLAREGAGIVGGNLTGTDGPASWTLTLMGEVERGSHWTRYGAHAGDLLAVTGSPGRAAVALALALAASPPSLADLPHALADALAAPSPRVSAALAMSATGAVRAAVDLSDGLSGDLGHLCEASGVGARVFEADLPADPVLVEGVRRIEALRAGGAPGLPPWAGIGPPEKWRLGPSDDYELLLAIDPAHFEACADAAAASGAPLTVIGRVVERHSGLCFVRRDGREEAIEDRGFDHYA